jgi:outer membrane lipoprotein SlyB
MATCSTEREVAEAKLGKHTTSTLPAVLQASGTTASGSLIGAASGAFFGPTGMYIGAVVGAMIGGVVAKSSHSSASETEKEPT